MLLLAFVNIKENVKEYISPSIRYEHS